jgi:hypothetical protein
MYKTFVYPSGSSAMCALRKAFKAQNVEVLYWGYVREGNTDKLRLTVKSPLVHDADIALEIYKDKAKDPKEVIVRFKLPQCCMIPLNFEAIAEKLEEETNSTLFVKLP